MTDEEAMARLREHYRWANEHKFAGILPHDYRIEWNPLLRRLTGRITYHLRLIEISTWHYRTYGFDDAIATLEHEMLHLYLLKRGLPSGHNRYFREAAAELGIRVYHSNHYPRNTAPRHRHLYMCPACGRKVFRRRRRDDARLACGECCRREAGGSWDVRFVLTFVETIWMI